MIVIIVYTSIFHGHSVPCLPDPTNNEYKKVSLGPILLRFGGVRSSKNFIVI